MRKQIIGIAFKITILAAFALITSGNIFANQAAKKNSIEKLWRTPPQAIAAKNEKEALLFNAVNQSNFNSGRSFTAVMYNAVILDENENAYQFLVVDLVELIFRFEDKVEETKLREILKSVVGRKMNGEQIRREIGKVARNYFENLPSEQHWYFNSGVNLAELVISSFLAESDETKNKLSKTKELIRIAPKEAPREIMETMNYLVNNFAQDHFQTDDYIAIYNRSLKVLNLADTKK